MKQGLHLISRLICLSITVCFGSKIAFARTAPSNARAIPVPPGISVLPKDTIAFLHLNLSDKGDAKISSEILSTILAKEMPGLKVEGQPLSSFLRLGLQYAGIKHADKIANGADGDVYLVLDGSWPRLNQHNQTDALHNLGLLFRDPEGQLLVNELGSHAVGILPIGSAYYKIPGTPAYVFAVRNYIGVAISPKQLKDLASGFQSQNSFAQTHTWKKMAKDYNGNGILSAMIVAPHAYKKSLIKGASWIKSFSGGCLSLVLKGNGLNLSASVFARKANYSSGIKHDFRTTQIEGILPNSRGLNKPYAKMLMNIPVSSNTTITNKSKFVAAESNLIAKSALGIGVYPTSIKNGKPQGMDALFAIYAHDSSHKMRAFLNQLKKHYAKHYAYLIRPLHVPGATSAYILNPRAAHQIRSAILSSTGASTPMLKLIENKTLTLAMDHHFVFIATSKQLLTRAVSNAHYVDGHPAPAKSSVTLFDLEFSPMRTLNGILPFLSQTRLKQVQAAESAIRMLLGGNAGNLSIKATAFAKKLNIFAHIPVNMSFLKMILNQQMK